VATYKLIQDVEAEDKILGPLTLRQFVFGLITAFLLYINFIIVTKGAAFLLVLFLPPAILTGFFAFPFKGDQPTEVWALAKIRFLFKPRLRIWNQSGVKDLVTINVPKRVIKVYTDGLSQTEVQSRLRTLADTIDSRGWAIKNVNDSSFVSPSVFGASEDRLIDLGSVPMQVTDDPTSPSEDMLDVANSPIARQFADMITQTSQAHRQALVDELNNTTEPVINNASTPWFMPPNAAPPVPVAANETPDEMALAARIKSQKTAKPAAYGNLRTIQPLGSAPAVPQQTPVVQAAPVEPPKAAPDPSVVALASNNDLDVATIARQANKAKGVKQGNDEVVISLH